jgi:predicted DCC family thiol-disulfide oxidoreductase YuxK
MLTLKNEMLASVSSMPHTDLTEMNLVLYDGDCGLCNRSVQFILKHEKPGSTWYFVPQNSQKGQAILSACVQGSIEDTLYVVEDKVLYKKSQALFRLAKTLRFPYNLIQCGQLFPRLFTDMLYDVVARNRKRIALKSCVVHQTNDQHRFIQDEIN